MFHVGDVVRKLRQQRGWTLHVLAKKAGVNKMTLSAIENGGNYQRDTLQRIVTPLGISLGRLETTLQEWAETKARPSGVIGEADRQLLGMWHQLQPQDKEWHLVSMQRSIDLAGQASGPAAEAQPTLAARARTGGGGRHESTPARPVTRRSTPRRHAR